MLTFVKAQAASLTASTIDFLTTTFCVEVLKMNAVIGSATGTILGGVTNFTMGRRWAFSARSGKMTLQMYRYILVWVGNLLLNTGGMYVATTFTNVNYLLAKVCISLIVGIGYNYTLQKYFVFKQMDDDI